MMMWCVLWDSSYTGLPHSSRALSCEGKVCWAEMPNPPWEATSTSQGGAGRGKFPALLTGLQPLSHAALRHCHSSSVLLCEPLALLPEDVALVVTRRKRNNFFPPYAEYCFNRHIFYLEMPPGFHLLIAEQIHAAALSPKVLPIFQLEAMEHSTLITKTPLFLDRSVFYQQQRLS